MQILLIVLVVSLALLVLYHVSRRVPIIGSGIAFVCVVLSRTFIRISQFADQAASYCNKACLTSLTYPPGDSECGPLVKVLSRIVYFILAVLLLSGETFSTLITVPVLFHTQLQYQLPNIVEIATASLFVAAPALEGAFILECLGLTARGAGLFPSMRKLHRIGLGLLTALVFVLSIVTLGYFYLYRGAYLIDPDSAQQMSLYILGALGICIAYTTALAFVALVIGTVGVVTVVLWLAGLVSRVVAFVASLVPSLLDILAVHTSQGTLSVQGEIQGPDPYQVSTPLFRPLESSLSLPEHASWVDGNLVEAENELEEKNLTNPYKNASLTFAANNFGTRMFVPIAHRINSLRAGSTILSSCFVDLEGQFSSQKSIIGVHDLSPSHTQITDALLHADGENNVYSDLFNGLAQRLIETHLNLKAVSAPFLVFCDCELLGSIRDLLEKSKRRLPRVSHFIVTSLSASQLKNSEVQAGLAIMQQLHSEGVVDLVLTVDPVSPFTTPYTKDTQQIFLANFLISLLVGHRQSSDNQSLTNLARDMQPAGPFMSVNFASLDVARGNTPLRWSWSKLIPQLRGKAGSGDYDDMLVQSREAINQCMAGNTTRAYPSVIDPTLPAKVVVTVPWELNDNRYPRFVRDTRLFVAQNFPNATSITVCGNGSAYPRQVGSQFRVQASVLYPHHLALPAVQEKQIGETNVAPLFKFEPDSIASNGHGLLNSTEAAVSGDSTETTKSGTTTPKATRRKVSSK